MAELSKKIYLKNSAGTQQTALLYSTTGESGTPYMPLTADGVAAYACLVSTSDTRATSGRVKHSNGNTYAIGTMSVPAYATKLITSGSGSFTVPAGVTKLRVTCVGGGAGGGATDAGWNYYNNSKSPLTFTPMAGGNTSFGSVVGKGATAAIMTFGLSSAVITAFTNSLGTNNGTNSAKLNSENNCAHNNVIQGGAAVPITNYAGTTIGSYGAGGYGDGGKPWFGLSGASGYKTTSTITVTAGQVISYSVGAGGKCLWKYTYYSYEKNSDGFGGALGSTGAIYIEWGLGIQ